MKRISNEDLDWIRGTPISRSINSAIPPVYEVYGLLDLVDDDDTTDLRLLAALGAAPDDRLIAGWIERSGSMTEPGDVQVLYANWRYRCREVTQAELDGRPSGTSAGSPTCFSRVTARGSSPPSRTTPGGASASARPQH